MTTTAPDRPAARLRGAGLRATRPRVLVLQLLDHLGGHRSADDLAVTLEQAGTPLPRATVYNVLRDLTGRGIVRGAGTGPGRALYELAGTSHHHFVCRRCRNVEDVDCFTDAAGCLDRGGDVLEGARVEETQVIFRGLCATCARAA